MIVNVIFCVETSNPESFHNLFLFFTNFCLLVLTEFVLIKKCIIPSVVTAELGFFINDSSFEGLRFRNFKHLLSTKHCSGTDCH